MDFHKMVGEASTRAPWKIFDILGNKCGGNGYAVIGWVNIYTVDKRVDSE